MDVDGSNKLRLTYFNEKDHPHYIGRRAIVSNSKWSPDGEKIAAIVAYESIWGLRTKIVMIELSNP